MATVRLRPLRPADFGALWAARHDGSAPDRRQTGAKQRLRARIARSGRFEQGRLDLGVEVAGRLVGQVEARRPRDAMPPGVLEIGIALFPDERGKGYGSEAIDLLCRRLFAELDVHRVQASTALANAAMRRVFEKLGFTWEGVLRGFMPSHDGTREDYALYAITREEWSLRDQGLA